MKTCSCEAGFHWLLVFVVVVVCLHAQIVLFFHSRTNYTCILLRAKHTFDKPASENCFSDFLPTNVFIFYLFSSFPLGHWTAHFGNRLR